MTPAQAMQMLEIEDSAITSVQDAYEEKVFQLTQLFLKDPVIPHLFYARLKKIQELFQAVRSLSPEMAWKPLEPRVRISLMEINTWQDLWLSYERNKAAIRTDLAGGYDTESLTGLIQEMVTHEMTYASVLLKVTASIPDDEQVKITQPVSSVMLISECMDLKNNGVIDESIHSLCRLSGKNATFNLSKEINRLRKITTHG